MLGAMLVAATTFIVLLAGLMVEADTLPALSRASARISVLPGVKPAKLVVSLQVFVSWSRVAWPTLLRLMKNSTSMTDPSESDAVAVRFRVDAVVADVGGVKLT